MTRETYLAQLRQRQRRVLAVLRYGIVPAVLIVFFALYWNFAFVRSTRLQHSRASTAMNAQNSTGTINAKQRTWGSYVLVMLVLPVGYFSGLMLVVRYLGTHGGPQCEHCGSRLVGPMSKQVLATGVCPLCQQPVFSTTGTLSPPERIPTKRFLSVTNLDKKLKPKYQLAITGFAIGAIVLSIIPTTLFAYASASLFGIPLHAAVIDQPKGPLWIALFLLFMGASVFVGACYGSLVLLAAVLRWFYGWSGSQIRELIFESQIPSHWLKEER